MDFEFIRVFLKNRIDNYAAQINFALNRGEDCSSLESEMSKAQRTLQQVEDILAGRVTFPEPPPQE